MAEGLGAPGRHQLAEYRNCMTGRKDSRYFQANTSEEHAMADGMLISGAAIIGWLASEFLGLFSSRGLVRIPVGMNILGAAAFGLIAAGIVLS